MRISIIAAAALLSGCSTLPPAAPVDVGAAPVCSSPADCDLKWSAARLFLLHNSGNKIERDTPDYIWTYNTNDSDLSGQVTREPAGAGAYKIVAVFGCHGVSDARFCVPMNPPEALAKFNREVGAAGAPSSQ